MTGSREETISNYLKAIRETVCHVFEERARDLEFMFGGPDKAVEVDEAFVSKRKYNAGRKEAKEDVWVVGITEVSLPRRDVNDPELLNAIKSGKEKKNEMATRRIAKRKVARMKRSMQVVQETHGSLSRERRLQMKRAVQVVQDAGLERANRQPDRRVDAPVVLEDMHDRSAFDIPERDFRGEIESLFNQSRKGEAKKTMFFIVETRDANTLHRIITKYVREGTTVFTDEWLGYQGLDKFGYIHKTMCHKRRFSMFECDQNEITRITTNHIERMC